MSYQYQPKTGELNRVDRAQGGNGSKGASNGLQSLSQLDKIMIQQATNILEAVTGWTQENKYSISTSTGQQIFNAFENSDACMRQCCGPARGFVITVTDSSNQPCLLISRDFKCCAGCCCCAGCLVCAYEVKVETPAGLCLGYVRQKFSLWSPKFEVLDLNQDAIMNIQGPSCICDGACCTADHIFNVTSIDGSHIANISKHYSGFFNEMFTSANYFSIEFPQALPVDRKATLLGALFLIDFMFFNVNKNQRNNSN